MQTIAILIIIIVVVIIDIVRIFSKESRVYSLSIEYSRPFHWNYRRCLLHLWCRLWWWSHSTTIMKEHCCNLSIIVIIYLHHQ